MDPGECPGNRGAFVAPRSSGCSMNAVLDGSDSTCRLIASKEKSAMVLPSTAFRLRKGEFHVKPRRHLEDLKGKGPLSLAQAARLNVEHGGVTKRASTAPEEMYCNQRRCTAGWLKSAFLLYRRSSPMISMTKPCFFASLRRYHATEFLRFTPEKR